VPRHFSAEEEADREGYNLLIRAGYDPTDAPKLFDVLNKDLEEPKIEEPFFLVPNRGCRKDTRAIVAY